MPLIVTGCGYRPWPETRSKSAFPGWPVATTCSIFIRANASRSMLASKNTAAPLPSFLTRYIAISAFWRKFFVGVAVFGIKADPDRTGGEYFGSHR